MRILRVRAYILGNPPSVFQELLMGLPDSFRKYWFLGREINITITRFTISGVMNTFSFLVIVEEFYRAWFGAIYYVFFLNDSLNITNFGSFFIMIEISAGNPAGTRDTRV